MSLNTEPPAPSSSSSNNNNKNKKTFGEKVQDAKDIATNALGTVANAADKVKTTVSQKINETTQSIDKSNAVSSMKESFDKVETVTSEFAEKNSFIAKTIFVVFIFILFGLFFRLGVYILSLFYLPSKNPIILKGTRSTQQKKIYTVNPTKSDPKPILRSINEHHGMEFTWSSWIFINGTTTSDVSDKPLLFFKKGTTAADAAEYSGNQSTEVTNDFLMNSPGLYLYDADLKKSNLNSISVVLSCYDNKDIAPPLEVSTIWKPYEVITVKEVPVKKWICVIIRVHGMIIDIYINGTLTKRKELGRVVKQNYGNIQVGDSVHGADGFISSLRYFGHAIGNNAIQDVLHSGPDLTMEGEDLTHTNPPYLSIKWYLDEIQNSSSS